MHTPETKKETKCSGRITKGAASNAPLMSNNVSSVPNYENRKTGINFSGDTSPLYRMLDMSLSHLYRFMPWIVMIIALLKFGPASLYGSPFVGLVEFLRYKYLKR